MRLIDADALTEKMRFDVCTDCLGGIKGCGNCYYDRAIDAINDAPTVDAVEVVRCKDCKSWQRNSGFTDSPNGFCFNHHMMTNECDFCSYGERKVSE